MNKIIVKEKNEQISYDEIHKILKLSHSVNNQKGFKMKTASLTGEQLKERIGSDGKCFVAIENNKIIGTMSVRFVKRNTWYAKGIIPDYILAAVLPEHQGRHINSMLANKVFDFVQKKGYDLIELDTAENNKRAIEIYKHQGFIPVNFCAFNGADHYSVVMVKWFKQTPYSKFYCTYKYLLKKVYVKTRYKIGGKKRFGI